MHSNSARPRSRPDVVGEVVLFHIRDDLLKDGKIATEALDPIARIAGPRYARLGEIVIAEIRVSDVQNRRAVKPGNQQQAIYEAGMAGGNMTTMDASSYSTGERTAIIASCMLGFALDLYDVLIVPFTDEDRSRSRSASPWTQVSSVAQPNLDRIGDRRRVVRISRRSHGPQAGVAADAVDVCRRLDRFRLCLGLLVARHSPVPRPGIGLSGEQGAGMVLSNEAWNKERRGIGSAFIQGSAVLAAASASIVGVWATTSFSLEWGWRIALLTGGSPILLMIFIRIFMPESKAWLQFDAAAHSSAGLRSKHRQPGPIRCWPCSRGGCLAISIMCLFWMMACYVQLLRHRGIQRRRSMQKALDVLSGNRAQHLADRLRSRAACPIWTMGALNDNLGRRSPAHCCRVCRGS